MDNFAVVSLPSDEGSLNPAHISVNSGAFPALMAQNVAVFEPSVGRYFSQHSWHRKKRGIEEMGRRRSMDTSMVLPLPFDGEASQRIMDRRFDNMLREHAAIEAEEAQAAGALVFMPGAVLQATLPYREPKDMPVWFKSNGRVSLLIQPGYVVHKQDIIENGKVRTAQVTQNLGFPYGAIPRLLLSWVATEAVKTQCQEVQLGKNLTSFMAGIGLIHASGGAAGSITRLKDQTRRLFGATINLSRVNESAADLSLNRQPIQITKRAAIWDTEEGRPIDPFGSRITLSDDFYRECRDHPVPVDFRCLMKLRNSALCLDIYSWLTWRYSFLTSPKQIPWSVLRDQFGTQAASERKFREAFRQALRHVLEVYPDARVDARTSGLVLIPSLTSISRRPVSA